METKNLYTSFTEVFDLKKEPLDILENCEIVPFYFNTKKDAFREGGRLLTFENPIVSYLDKAMIRDSFLDTPSLDDRGIPSLILEGNIIGLYLPFHFYYKPDEPRENQIWGVWVLDEAVDWFASRLEELDCRPEIKKHLAKVYAVNFALFFHKLEIFVTSNHI